MTPTQRTLKKLREEGYTAEVVEKRIPGMPVTKDLFGFIDVIAIREGETLAVQTTSGSNVAARCRKIADNPNLAAVRAAGWGIHVHGWRKSKKSKRWELRVVDVS